MKRINKALLGFLTLLLVVFVVQFVGTFAFKRFDLTHDQRYTLSDATRAIVASVDAPLIIDVFLEGDFPPEFRRLQTETKQLLEEYQTLNPHIHFQFINPLEGNSEEENTQLMLGYGFKPIHITVNDKGKQSQELVFPWAMAYKGEKASKIQLLKNNMGATIEENVIGSVQNLEYVVTEAIAAVSIEKTKSIAVLKGNGELDDIYMADFLKSVRETYHIAPFTLDSVAKNPNRTLEQLKAFDMALIAKPTQAFTDEQLLVLDQYIMNGGHTLWLIDQVQADLDSLKTMHQMPIYAMDQNLGALFFKYGFRINPVLVRDEVGTPIRLAMGRTGSETRYQDFIWKFAPFVMAESEHAIVKNLDGIRFDFTNPIDTLRNAVSKTILLKSSPYSRMFGTPAYIDLEMVNEQLTERDFETNPGYNLAVLLEGNFSSAFQNRVKPFHLDQTIDQSPSTKMVVVSDGDIIRNQLDQDLQPLELGYDKWTNKLYANKEFLLNTVHYMLDDTGRLSLRTKEVYFPMLDKEKVYADYSLIQTIAILVPLFLLLLFGVLWGLIRKRRFAKKLA